MDTMNKDPNGLGQHSPGAKLDAGKIRPSLVLGGFARALRAVSEVGTFGAVKYTDNGWTEVPNGVTRYTDAALRHYLAEQYEGYLDNESGLPHAAHLAWNALARLELMLREGEEAQFEQEFETAMRALDYSALDSSIFERGSN